MHLESSAQKTAEPQHLNRLMLTGVILMAFSAVLGAFGSHVMRELLTPERLDTWHTAVRYQVWHGLALLLLAEHRLRSPDNQWLAWSARLILIGILLFSGSLYLLCLTGVTVLGAVTPLGGVAFIAAWICWAVALLRQRH